MDRLWPRGIKKERAHPDLWLKEIAPSKSLRNWFNHDPKKWPKFKEKYLEELARKKSFIKILLNQAREGNLTLIYSAKDTEHNQAIVLKEYLEAKLKNY